MKNSFNFEGKFLRIDTFVTKGGKEILSAILEVADDKYPTVTAVKFFGRGADELKEIVPGSTVSITGKLGGREWQGKVFPEITGWSIEAIGSAPAPTPEPDFDGEEPPF